jgi:hypothetical protein
MLTLVKLLSKLTCIGILIGWFALWIIVFTNSIPKSPQPLTHHTIPFNNHGTTIYFTELQDGFRRWAIPVWLGVALFYWLAEFNLKKRIKNAGPKRPTEPT